MFDSVCVSPGEGSLSAAPDFHQFSSSSSSSRLEREHDRGADEHNGEERKARHRRPAVQEEEEEEDDKDEKEEEEEEEEDCKYHKPPALTPADGPLGGSEGNSSPFENKVTISTFGSIMRITSSSALGSNSKIRKISSGDYKPPKSICKPSPVSAPPILEEADLKEKATPPPLPHERRHRGSKKSRHGPGRPRGSKNRERREEEHHHLHAAAPPPPALTSSLYPTPSIPACPTTSSSLSSSSAGSFSAGRGGSLLGSGESERAGVCGSPNFLCACVCLGGRKTPHSYLFLHFSLLKCLHQMQQLYVCAAGASGSDCHAPLQRRSVSESLPGSDSV